MSRMRTSYLGIALILASAWFVAGCENAIDPIHDAGFEPFAIHGYLDMRSDRQVVRIESLRPNVLSNPVSLEGVQVSTIESETGRFQIWNDSLVVLDSGDPGLVFTAEFRPVLGYTYRLLISRDGQNGAEAIAKLPTKPAILLHNPVGDSLHLRQNIVLQGMTETPNQVILKYVVVPPDDSGERTVRIAYGMPGAATSEGWEFDVDLVSDRFIILNQLDLTVLDKSVTVRSISMEMTVFSDEWKEPQKEANLEHAHGFFGSVGVIEHGWLLDETTLKTLGFIDGQKRN